MSEPSTRALPSSLSPGRLFIGGEWVEAANGKTFDVVNPAQAEKLTKVAAGDAEGAKKFYSALAGLKTEGPYEQKARAWMAARPAP